MDVGGARWKARISLVAGERTEKKIYSWTHFKGVIGEKEKKKNAYI